MKRWLCKIDMHSFAPTYIAMRGISAEGECRWCGGRGLIDSQGNLFGVPLDNPTRGENQQ